MASSISLGNFTNIGGKNVLTGSGGSGLDTKGLIEAFVTAKSAPQLTLKDKVTLNGKKTEALNKLQTLVSNFKDAANFLRNPPGVGNQADDVFKYTTTSITASNGITGSTYMTVTASPGANIQSYTIDEIESVAKAKKQTTNTFTVANADAAFVKATPAAGEFGDGTLTLNGEEIHFAAGDSLNTVVAKFNTVSGDTGVRASIVQVSSTQFQLVFTATTTGEDANFDLGDPDDPTALSITDPDGVFTQITFDTLQDAQNAVFTIDNVEITRQTNNISDVISGLTFNLVQATPALTTLNVDVSADTQTAKNGVINFINAYNDLKIFATKQMTYNEDGTPGEDSVLINDQALRSLMNDVSSMLSAVVSGAGFTNLGEAGITFADLPESDDNPFVRNILNVDEAKLTNALSSNFLDVKNLFGFNFQANNSNLRLFSSTNALAVNSFTLNLTFAKAKAQDSSSFMIADADQAVVAAVSTPGMFTAGTVTVRGVDITLDDGDTLNEVAAKFEAVKSQTGISASVVEVAPGEFKLAFASTSTGTSNDFNLSDAGTVTDPGSVFQNITFSTTQAAVNDSFVANYTVNGSPASTQVDLVAVTGGGYTIKGRSGTVLEGMIMIYGTSGDASINVTATQGVAEKIYNVARGALDENTGLLTVNLKSIEDNTSRLEDDIARMDAQIATFREQLLAKFARLEQAISQINNLLQSLSANDDARNNASS